MTDRSDAVVVTARTEDGRGIRHEYEPTGDGWEHSEYVLTKGDGWKRLGGNQVTTLDVETPD